MNKLRQHWPAVAVTTALVLALLAAQLAIFNTEPIDAAELDARLVELQRARTLAGGRE